MRAVSLLLLFLPISLFSQVDQKKLKIQGNLEGLAENSRVYLIDVNSPTDTIAKSIAKAGAFILEGKVKEPYIFNLHFEASKKKHLLFIGNDDIRITGSVVDLKSLKVVGSPSHDDFVSFQYTFNPLFQEYTNLSQQASKTGLSDSASKRVDYLFKTIQTKLSEFISQRKNSYVSPFVMVVTSQLDDNMVLMEKRFNSLSKQVQEGYFGKYVNSMIMDSKIGAVGTTAIDFVQNDTSGKPVSLSSFRGKYVLVDFWASWCGPCRSENPNVVEAYNKFKEKNFTILGVSLDRSRDSWLKAIKDDELAWTQVSDLKFWSNEAALKYKISSIPQNFLIGPEGMIVARNLRGEALQAKLCEILGCN